tara:strand:- start:70 stop:282 length:213 start_codon:yes stop_codon:yes gene_type:complete
MKLDTGIETRLKKKSNGVQEIIVTRGGKRKGAGRKSIYDEPVKQIGFVVPISKVNEFKEYCKQFLNKFLK